MNRMACSTILNRSQIGNLRRLGWRLRRRCVIRVASGLCAVLLAVPACDRLATSQVHLIPAKYRGRITIRYGKENGQDQRDSDGAIVVRVAGDGYANVATIPRWGTVATHDGTTSASRIRVFMVGEDSARREVPMRWYDDQPIDTEAVQAYWFTSGENEVNYIVGEYRYRGEVWPVDTGGPVPQRRTPR